ncbi:YSIRK-type signal peptide-containing protein [Lactobacillus sp. Marseille-P7033]|nr:YSIRK-type signal peptide-containing protein [Lactobacillus sp. Marseille-P7033]NGC78068.1 YSIRK-type signal peptide-containing protein [Limosilactobacillus reuteri]
MLSKNNRKEQFYKQEPKKQRFAIKKLTIGVASVLIGFTFMGLSAYAADDVNPGINSGVQTSAVETSNDDNATSGGNQQTSSAKASETNANNAINDAKTTKGAAPADEGQAVKEQKATTPAPATNNGNVVNKDAVTNAVTENKSQVNDTVKVGNYSEFLTALGNKDVNTITLTGNIDGSSQLRNSQNSLADYDQITNQGVAHTVTINGQGQYSLKMGARYIYFTNNTETNNNHWNITFAGLSNIQAQNTQYGLLCIQTNDPSKDSINFKNVNVDATTLNAGYGSGAVNVTFSGNNVLKGDLSGNNALVQTNNLEIKDGTTTVTPTANNATGATSFSVAGNAIIDSNAKLNIVSTADNVAGITFTTGAGNQTIDNATTGVLRLMPNAQAVMNLGAGKSMAVMNASDIDLQNGSQLSVNTKMNTTGSRAYAPIELDSGQNDVADSTVQIGKDAKLAIIRTGVAHSDSPLLSMGPNVGLGNNYHLLVNGGSLDLQDSANSDLWPTTAVSNNYQLGWPGIITMWGTSSTDQIQFTNPKLVNIIRTNATTRGSYLIHLDSGGSRKSSLQINSADTEYVTPITMRTVGSTESTTWNIKYLSNASQGGNWAYSFQKLTKGNTDYYFYGSEYMNHAENVPARGNNEVILAPTPTDTGYTSFSGGNYLDNDGNKVSLAEGQSKASQALNNFINQFSWWNGSGVTFGSDLQQKNEYQPTYEGTQVKQGQQAETKAPLFKDADNKEVSAPNGVEFSLGANTLDWVKSIASNGAITVAPTTQTNVGLYNIPVKVTYSDGTIDNVVAPIYVGDATHTIVFGNNGAVAVVTNSLLLHQTTAQSMNVDANQAVEEFDVYTPNPTDPTVLNTTPEKFAYNDGQFIDGVNNLGGKNLVNWDGEFSTVTSPATLSASKTGNITITFSEDTLPVKLGIFTANYKVNSNVSTTLAGAVLKENASLTISKGNTPDSMQLKSLVNNSVLDTLPSSIKAINYELVPGTDTNTVGKQNLAIRIIFNDKDASGNNTYLDLSPIQDGLTVIADKTDAEKNDPVGRNITTDLNQVPAAEKGIENASLLTNVQKIAWSDEDQVANDVKTAGTYNEDITVTYTDGSKDTVAIKLTVIDNRTDAEKYTPEGQDVTVKKGETPDPENGIKNKDGLPDGTKYTWKNTPDTTTPGDKPAVITVTYPDGSVDQVPTTVHVNPTDADKYTPKGQNIAVNKGAKVPAASTAITNGSDLPKNTTYTWETTPDTNKVGKQPAVVVVTYPDGSKDIVPVVITVKNPATPTRDKTDADKNDPRGGTIDATLGENLANKASEGIINKNELTNVKSYTWTNGTPSTMTAGLTMQSVTVTYDDGSKDVVPVYVNVTSDADKYTPEPAVVTVKSGEMPNPADGIKNKGDLPQDTKYSWKTPVDTTTPGNKPAVVVVTYPDGSKDEVPTVVHVTKPTDADENTPVTQPINTVKGRVPNPADGIKNLKDLPAGTTVNWTDPDKVAQDVNTTGDHDEKVVVTYPDGSKDTVNITVKVTNDIKPLPYNKNNAAMNSTVTRTIIVINPDGTKTTSTQTAKFTRDGVEINGVAHYNAWQPASQTFSAVTINQIKGYTAKVNGDAGEVTVNGDSTDMTVEISYQANQPVGQEITTNKGQLPDPSAGIKNKNDLPDGTKYEWKDTPDVNTAGDKSATVVVTTPNGTKTDVPVTIRVQPTDADKYTPETQPVVTPNGQVPGANTTIKNLDNLPSGTKVDWVDPNKVTQDVKNDGTHSEKAVVTYPDGSKDVVTVTVKVVTPQGQDISTTQGQLPNSADAIKNKDQMPTGTKYVWKQAPDIDTLGNHAGVVKVIFPDGAIYDVTVQVHVLAGTNSSSNSNENGEMNTGANNAGTNNNVNNGNGTNGGNTTLNASAANANSSQLSANNTAATNNNGSQQAMKKLPQTGNDSSKLSALAGLSLASLAGIFSFAGRDKKRKADK